MTAPLSREQLAGIGANEDLIQYVIGLQNRLGMFGRRPPLKIAIIGSAPSSVQFAPYNDPTWRIWGCSPGAVPMLKRPPDAWYEIHRWEPPAGYTGQKPWFTPEYVKWMASIPGPVYAIDRLPELPNSVAYPKDAMVKKFGPYVMASTPSWMVALAVAAGATEIGLWGIDMAAKEEWVFQRTALQCLLWNICDRNPDSRYNIKITIPPESDIWVPPPLYGFCEATPMQIKLQKRREELADRMRMAQNNLDVSQRELLFLQGAADNNDYQLATWCIDDKAKEMSFATPTWATVPLDPVIEEMVNEGLPMPMANGHAEAVAG
jgi:hypothetical protein